MYSESPSKSILLKLDLIESEESCERPQPRTPFATATSCILSDGNTSTDSKRNGSIRPDLDNRITQVYENQQTYSETPNRSVTALQSIGNLYNKQLLGQTLPYHFRTPSGQFCFNKDDPKQIDYIKFKNDLPILFDSDVDIIPFNGLKHTTRNRKARINYEDKFMSTVSTPIRKKPFVSNPNKFTSSLKFCHRDSSLSNEIYFPSLGESPTVGKRKRLRKRSQNTRNLFLRYEQSQLAKSFNLLDCNDRRLKRLKVRH